MEKEKASTILTLWSSVWRTRNHTMQHCRKSGCIQLHLWLKEVPDLADTVGNGCALWLFIFDSFALHKNTCLSWVQIMLPLWAKVLNSRMVCLLTTSPGNLGEEKIIQGWNHSRVMPKPAALLKHNASFSLNKMVVHRILNWIQYVLSERRTPLKATSHRPDP